MTEKSHDLIGLQEGADYAHVTRQSIYIAIRKGNLKAEKINRMWHTTKEAIDEYRANKYNPDRRKFEGEKIYNIEAGYFSVLMVAKVIGEALRHPYGTERVYYLLRTGMLKGYKKGSQWVIKREDAIWLYQKETGHNPNQLSFA